MKIVVSQSGKQYTYELLKALVKGGHEVTFITLFWFHPNQLIYQLLRKLLPARIHQKLIKELGKKFDEELKDIRIIHFPVYEILRKIGERFSFIKKGEQLQAYFDGLHDQLSAKKLNSLDFDLFIGYEMSSVRSFEVVKRKNKTAVLDLAQIHYQEIEVLAQTYPSLSHLKTDEFRQKLNLIKEKEYQLADRILVLSAFAEASMLKHGIEQEQLHVNNLGFNPTIFRSKAKKLKDFSKEELNILYVGAIIKRKGIIELFEAVAALTQQTSFKIRVTLVGGMIDGDVVEKYKNQVQLTHHPFMRHEDLNAKYQGADLFVFPSLLDSWAMVVLESLATGTAAIITENTGAKDAIKKYGGGKVIRPGNVEELKSALLSYLQEPATILTDGATAVTAAANFDWSYYHHSIQQFVKQFETGHAQN